MRRTKPMSFYEYMLRYPFKEPERVSLAREFRKFGKTSQRLREIDSMIDLMSITDILMDPEAMEAVSPSLWIEYCLHSGRDIFELD